MPQDGGGLSLSALPLAFTVAQFTKHMVISPPHRGPAPPWQASETSYPWMCLGSDSTAWATSLGGIGALEGSLPHCWADQL